MRSRIGMIVLLLSSSTDVAGSIVEVAGQVVDQKGEPIAEARVAAGWFAEPSASLEPVRPTRTAANGRFSLRVGLHGNDTGVMAIDPTGRLGGVAVIPAKGPGGPIRIAIAPLVEFRVQFTCEELGQSPGETSVTMFLEPGRIPVAAGRSLTSTFAMRLPPGRYRLSGGESHRHVGVDRQVTLEPGRPVDLGVIDLKLTSIARLFGKEPPPWHITDARGISKHTRLSDFKGKWVVLEFWGFWCGPCLARGLPAWVDFFDDHAVDRDKFAILAIHDPQATDFAMLDKKLEPVIRRLWRGRVLPFPIVLDTTGETGRNFGVVHWPTVVLLDPDGRVVDVPVKAAVFGQHVQEFLASKLPPLSPAVKIARALDRDLSLFLEEDFALAELMDFYGKFAQIRIRLEPGELKAAGIDADTPVPLVMNAKLTLRAWLNLALDPFGLTYVAEGDALRVVRRTRDNGDLSRSSARQKAENALVALALKAKVTFDFQDEPLNRVVTELIAKTGESFVLDPNARRSGAIKPETKVTGKAVDEPLAAALMHLLAPIGMTYVVQNEAIVLTAKR